MGKEKAITCLRPSPGGLHLGHYIGNVKPLIEHQNICDCTFVFADLQSMNGSRNNVDENIELMMRQMIAIGLDVNSVKVYRESTIKKESLYDFIKISDYLSVSRINRLPMIKSQEKIPKMSLFVFPILQILDFYKTKASMAFSNIDNKAVIELTNEVFSKINNADPSENLPHINLVHGKVDLLVGIDGRKMSKKNNNCINFIDSPNVIMKKVNKMYTDPNRIHVGDKGHIDNNVVFKYIDAFFDDDVIKEYKQMYICGKVGDSDIKKILSNYLTELILDVQNKVNDDKEKDVMKYVI